MYVEGLSSSDSRNVGVMDDFSHLVISHLAGVVHTRSEAKKSFQSFKAVQVHRWDL